MTQQKQLELLLCQCGEKADEVEWTPSINYGGKTYQTCWVTCTSCDTDVSITVDADLKHDSNLYMKMVCDMWNNLTRIKKENQNDRH